MLRLESVAGVGPQTSRNRWLRWAQALAILVALNSVIPVHGEGWIKVESDNFHIYTDLPWVEAQQVAFSAEQVVAAANQLSPRDLSNPIPVTLFAFSSHKGFASYEVGGPGVAGYLVPHRSGSYGAFLAANQGGMKAVYRQAVHQILTTHFPGLPLWFRYGLAEFYSSFEMGEGHFSIGLPIQSHLWQLGNGSGPPLGIILSANERQAVEIADYSARCWALVHYLILQEEEFGQQLNEYMRLIEDLERPSRAFRSAFGTSPLELEKRALEHIKGDRFLYLKIPVSDLTIPQLRSRNLSPEQAHLSLLELQLFTLPNQEGSQLDRVGAQIEAVTQQHPENAHAWTLLAETRVRQERWGDAVDAARKAVALESSTGRAAQLLGQALVRTAGARKDAESELLRKEAVAQLEGCVSREPGNVVCWERLALAYAGQTKVPDRGIEVGEKIVRQLPGRDDLLYNLLLMKAKRGQSADVREHLTRLAAMGTAPSLVLRGRELLLQLSMREAREHMKADRLSDALGVLSEVQARTTSDALRAKATEWIDSVSKVKAYNQFAERYSQAVVAYQSQEWDRAVETLQALIVDSKPGPQRNVATRLLEEVAYWRE